MIARKPADDCKRLHVRGLRAGRRFVMRRVVAGPLDTRGTRPRAPETCCGHGSARPPLVGPAPARRLQDQGRRRAGAKDSNKENSHYKAGHILAASRISRALREARVSISRSVQCAGGSHRRAPGGEASRGAARAGAHQGGGAFRCGGVAPALGPSTPRPREPLATLQTEDAERGKKTPRTARITTAKITIRDTERGPKDARAPRPMKCRDPSSKERGARQKDAAHR
jgi:hypothetical protein